MKCSRLLHTLVFFSVFGGMLIYAAEAFAAYSVDYMYVCHREFEDGSSYNHLGFNLRDASGQLVSDENVVTNVVLYDPDNQPVSLGELKFFSEESGGGQYDGWTGKWSFYSWQMDAGFYSSFSDSLKVGTYRVAVTTNDGPVEGTCSFNGLVNLLAIVSLKSFSLSSDASGNFTWTWEVPKNLGPLAVGTNDTQVRAIINFANGQQHVGTFKLRVPTHMGFIFLPSSIVQQLVSKGNRFELFVQVRTNDNNNRTESNRLNVGSLLTAVSVPKNAVVIPLY